MSVERIVLAFAGLMILLSLGLGVAGSPISITPTGSGSPLLLVSTFCSPLSPGSVRWPLS